MLKYWFIFVNEKKIILSFKNENFTIPLAEKFPFENENQNKSLIFHSVGEINLGQNRIECLTVNLDFVPQLVDYQLVELRETYNLIDEKFYVFACKSREILHWDINSQFCPRCGTQTVQIEAICKKCAKCGTEIWPQVTPAIIVLIKNKKNEILMTKGKNFSGNFMGLVSGFVETGENLEECVCREVYEETSLRINNLRYIASQTWPFPNQLMIGFFADYESGEIKMQTSELTECRWVKKNNLPNLPPNMSMAKKLIEIYLSQSV